MEKQSGLWKRFKEPTVFLLVFFLIFGVLGNRMGLANMLNTMMKTAYSLLIETCFYSLGRVRGGIYLGSDLASPDEASI